VTAAYNILARLNELPAEDQRLALGAWRNSHKPDQALAAANDPPRQSRQLPPKVGQRACPSTSLGRAFEGYPRGAQVPEATSVLSQTLEPSVEAGRHLVLVVEDEPDDYILLRRAFRHVGLTAGLCWVRTTREALELLAKVGSDVASVHIISDIQLPREDGFAFLSRIKAGACARPVKFAFLTGRCDDASRERACACGADGYFIKPLAFADLVVVAAALFGLFTDPLLGARPAVSPVLPLAPPSLRAAL
jgi:CheY-like chemotaxis protein